MCPKFSCCHRPGWIPSLWPVRGTPTSRRLSETSGMGHLLTLQLLNRWSNYDLFDWTIMRTLIINCEGVDRRLKWNTFHTLLRQSWLLKLNPATGTGKAHPSLESKDHQLNSGTSKDGGFPISPSHVTMSHLQFVYGCVYEFSIFERSSSFDRRQYWLHYMWRMKKFASEISN